MRPVPTHSGTTITNASETIKGRIDAEHTVHIMHQLSDLYSDPLMALLREYGTNALDSHIEAGYHGPVEIELPREGSPKLIIRDFGLGLSLDELRETYLSYGSSSKRDSDEVAGTLGFGSKAGVAYAPLGWQVTAVKRVPIMVPVQIDEDGTELLDEDGNVVYGESGEFETRKIHATVAKDSMGVPEMAIIANTVTDAPNGVTISIPINEDDFDKCAWDADHLFQFWPAGSVVVRDEHGWYAPRSVRQNPNLVWIRSFDGDESVALAPGNGAHSYGTSYVVMGNVPYRTSIKSAMGHNIIAFVPMGSVHFSPSREDLKHTDLTNETLDALVDFVNHHAAEQVVSTIIDGATPWERLRRYYNVWDTVETEYRVRHIDPEVRPWLPDQRHDFTGRGAVYKYAPRKDRNAVDRIHRVTPETFGLHRHGYRYRDNYKVHVVENFTPNPKTLSPKHRQHLKDWLHLKYDGLYGKQYVLIPTSISEVEFLEGFDGPVDDWSAIVEATPPPPSSRTARSKTQYMMHRDGQVTSVFEDEVPTDRPLLFEDSGYYHAKRHPDVTIIDIKSFQFPKFQRLYPQAKPAHEYDVERVAEVRESLTLNDRIRMTVGGEWAWLKSIASELEDPELVNVIRLATDGKQSNRQKAAARLGVGTMKPTIFKELEDRYPLLDNLKYVGQRHLDHVVTYLNAVWRDVEWDRQLEEVLSVSNISDNGHSVAAVDQAS